MSEQSPEPFGVRIGPAGIVVTGNSVGDPVNTAEALDKLLAYAFDDTGLQTLDDARRMLHGVILALEGVQRERGRLTAELDEVTDLDRSALKTQELRDERMRAVAKWHEQKKRGDLAEDSLRHLRAAIATELPPMTFVKERLATHPYGGEQNWLELAEALWRHLGEWPEDPNDVQEQP